MLDSSGEYGMDADQRQNGSHVVEVPLPPSSNLEALADRLREVRRQLSRGKPLAGVLDRRHQSVAALRAAQRLESAVRRLDEEMPIRRVVPVTPPAELPWLVRVVEQRATALEAILASHGGPLSR